MGRIAIQSLQVGAIVKVHAPFLNEPVGVLALVYEQYGNSSVSIITENGTDLGGFNEQEQDMYLSYEYDSGMHYSFRNVMQLHRDFGSGLLAAFFNKSKGK